VKSLRIGLMAIAFSCSIQAAGDKYANSFLEIGVGARALGMGGAFCGISDDGHAFYWNPAGTSLLKRPRISAMYGPQFGSISNPLGNFHFIGYVQPLKGDVVLGFHWIRLAVDDIPVYSELHGGSYMDRLRDRSLRPGGDPEGTINDSEDAYFFTFSKRNSILADLGWLYHKVRIELPMGINLKWIHQSIGEESATGLGVDFGMMARLYLNDLFLSDRVGWLAFGLQIQDITRTSMRWSTRRQESAERNVKWGVAYECPLPMKNNLVRLALDRDSRDGGVGHLGLEFLGFRRFSLRIGSDGGRFTGGAGLRIKTFEVDYAFQSHSFDSLHRLGCALSF
jgi:hypothetical protein